jgi:hypothetical protein
MNRFGQRRGEALERAQERRRREDSAPRLIQRVPKLESLRLDIEEHQAGGRVPESTHIRRIVVEHAPALFDIPCLDTPCKEGGHDVTEAILRSLSAGQTTFEGKDSCNGQTGTAPCQRVLHFKGTATYRP